MSDPLLAAVRAGDGAEAQRLLDAGASPRRGGVLHAAAERGPLELVELLIRGGAIEWQPDGGGRSPLDAARAGSAADRDAIVELLDRPVIRDPSFRVAVAAIHAGDLTALERLLDAEPRLLRERILEPGCYRESGRQQYFLDPKLIWFVAGNPVLVAKLPANIVVVTRALLVRGVEREDLDYTLELVITSAAAREQGHQRRLIDALVFAGATASPRAIERALAHGELAAVEALQQPVTAPVAAARGHAEELSRLLATAAPGEVQTAFGLAVINAHADAARVALDAGADVNAFLPVHGHSVALHQAALHDDVELLELLVARGARADVRDTLWDGTPLGWAIHEQRPRAAAYLERLI
jgi:peptide-methionine (S)-S-oxide reductase